MIRVGIFIDTFNIGGAETVAINLAKQLSTESGYQPVIIHFDAAAISERCLQLNIQQLMAPARKYYKKTYTLLFFAWAFRRFLKEHNIDVLHTHLFGPIIASAPATWLSGIPHIGTLHDTYTIEERPARIHMLRLAVRLKTKLIVVSQQMENYYRQQANFAPDAITNIYNGVLPNTCNETDRQVTRQSLDIGENEVVVICVARLVQLKRHDILIKAISKLNGDVKIRLLIVGDGPGRQKLEALSQALGLNERVIFLGERDDVALLLNAADIFTLTSDTEGLSCSILEAMAANLPLLATNAGGNYELIRQGGNGFLVDKESSNQVAEKLDQLIQDPQIRKRFGKASSMIVQEKFDWNKTFSQYKKLYRI